MSTSNFHNVNASAIFACELEQKYDYDDLVDNLQIEFPQGRNTNIIDPDELRSYPSRIIGVDDITKEYKHFGLEVCIYPLIRSGYYQGCNLDWFIKVYMDGDELDYPTNGDIMEQVSEVKDALIHVLEMEDVYKSPKQIEKMSFGLANYINKCTAKLVDKVEEVFSRYSTPLKVAARFSNGETIYTKIK